MKLLKIKVLEPLLIKKACIYFTKCSSQHRNFGSFMLHLPQDFYCSSPLLLPTAFNRCFFTDSPRQSYLLLLLAP